MKFIRLINSQLLEGEREGDIFPSEPNYQTSLTTLIGPQSPLFVYAEILLNQDCSCTTLSTLHNNLF